MGALCCEGAVLLQQTNANRRCIQRVRGKSPPEILQLLSKYVEVVLILFLMTEKKCDKILKMQVNRWPSIRARPCSYTHTFPFKIRVHVPTPLSAGG